MKKQRIEEVLESTNDVSVNSVFTISSLHAKATSNNNTRNIILICQNEERRLVSNIFCALFEYKVETSHVNIFFDSRIFILSVSLLYNSILEIATYCKLLFYIVNLQFY